MPTLKQEFIYFNDAVGRTLPNAKLYAYEAGTTTPKNTYTGKSLTNKNPHPVVSDAAGRFPVIWLESGGYRIIVEDEDGVQIHDRDDINSADEDLNATSSIYFKTLADLKLLIAQNGQTVNPQIGTALRTTGKTSTTDDEGAEWVVVAGGTGTADDDTYVDLDNGLQAERVFNQLYTKNRLSEIADDGAAAQTTARGNLGEFTTVNYADDSVTAPKLAETTSERDWVLGRTAAAGVAEVGTYALLRNKLSTDIDFGETTTGDNLVYSSAGGASGVALGAAETWKAMGVAQGTASAASPDDRATLFLRIS